MYKLKLLILLFPLTTLPYLFFYLATSYLNLHHSIEHSLKYQTEKLLNYLDLRHKNDTHQTLINHYALLYNLHPEFLSSLMIIESNKQEKSVSSKGAIGLMQIIPSNYKRCKLNSPKELKIPELNIKCGAQIISEEISANKGDIYKALMTYNGGTKALSHNYPESLNHAKKVLQVYANSTVHSPLR